MEKEREASGEDVRHLLESEAIEVIGTHKVIANEREKEREVRERERTHTTRQITQ